MLDEPYRWVEAIHNRREYLEDQLEGASPVVGVSYADGVLLLTSTPGPRKVFEVYDQVAFAGIGHPADIEKLRKAIIDIAHVEAFNLSPSDVSLQRLVAFGLGPLVKAAFDEIFRSPFISKVMVTELDPADPLETFYTVDADGSFLSSADAAVVSDTTDSAAAILEHLRDGDDREASLEAALVRALDAWAMGRARTGREPDEEGKEGGGEPVTEQERGAAVRAALDAGRIEAAVLDRTLPTKTKFRLLAEADLEGALAPFR
jgi:proteasome alpha subunit